MRRFVFLCAALVAFFGMGIPLARLAGSRQPASPQLGFERCALPCYAGIIPGITSVKDARHALGQLTGSRGSEEKQFSGKWVYSTNTVQILLETDFHKATRLDMDSIQEPALITLGDTILTLGPPSLLYVLPLGTAGHYEIFLNYSTAHYGVYFLFRVENTLNPRINADAVKIYLLSEQALSIPLFPVAEGRHWRGFGIRSLDAE